MGWLSAALSQYDVDCRCLRFSLLSPSAHSSPAGRYRVIHSFLHVGRPPFLFQHEVRRVDPRHLLLPARPGCQLGPPRTSPSGTAAVHHGGLWRESSTWFSSLPIAGSPFKQPLTARNLGLPLNPHVLPNRSRLLLGPAVRHFRRRGLLRSGGIGGLRTKMDFLLYIHSPDGRGSGQGHRVWPRSDSL